MILYLHIIFQLFYSDGGSDEKNCTLSPNNKCGVNEYKCEGEDKCLSIDWICDGDKVRFFIRFLEIIVAFLTIEF